MRDVCKDYRKPEGPKPKPVCQKPLESPNPSKSKPLNYGPNYGPLIELIDFYRVDNSYKGAQDGKKQDFPIDALNPKA